VAYRCDVKGVYFVHVLHGEATEHVQLTISYKTRKRERTAEGTYMNFSKRKVLYVTRTSGEVQTIGTPLTHPHYEHTKKPHITAPWYHFPGAGRTLKASRLLVYTARKLQTTMPLGTSLPAPKSFDVIAETSPIRWVVANEKQHPNKDGHDAVIASSNQW
jgi:hypothetical protein